ncbi:FHA domain-containing protein [Ktedonospora formicarum]|uniref:FHA domain-containing protein n=1 Tax=Ktedonospora formicarum TaxID=2778364 RepID=A0A8J3MQB3_9CHLR|nr:FHA domain-containing protein [Ktedonospora formicarum]GHO43810.1 hypothetical protein KSX_19730 [Ktedonospora formicarum]
MDARFYNSEDIDIERLASDLVNAYMSQGYQAQHIGNRDQTMVQIKKGGDFEAIIGMQAALSVTLQRTTGGVLAMIGQQKWIDKAAVGAVGIVALPILWPLALTAGVGALRQASLSNQVLNMTDGLVRQQRPGIMPGPIPYHLLPPSMQPIQPPANNQVPVYVPQNRDVPKQPMMPPPVPMPAGGGFRCQHCNTPYEPGDTFCSGCGRSLTPPKLYCSRCNSEVKDGAAFCPKCGASTFHTISGQAATQTSPPMPAQPKVTYTPAPQPRPTPPPTPVYTPPTPPPTPVYTPPTPPPTPVYTPPSQQPTYTPPAPQPSVVESTVLPGQQQPPKPSVPEYVPPTPQNPAVVPQPKVTYTQSTEKKEPAAPPKKPEVQYYVPSNPQDQVSPAPAQPQVTYTPSTEKKEPAAPPQPKKEEVYYTPPAHLQQQVDQAKQAQGNKAHLVEPAQRPAPPRGAAQEQAAKADVAWGALVFADGSQMQLKGERSVVGRYDHDLGGIRPDIDLSSKDGADTISRIHAAFEHSGDAYMLTDLNSTNATRVNGKRLEPDQDTPLNDGDSLAFGKVTCTFKRL